MNDDDLNFTSDELKRPKSRNIAQAWVRKLDREHCAVTLGDDDSDSPRVQARCTAMRAAQRAVEFFGRDARNIYNESRTIQIIFCISYYLKLRK